MTTDRCPSHHIARRLTHCNPLTSLPCSFTLNGGNRFNNAKDVSTWLGGVTGLGAPSVSGDLTVVMRLDFVNHTLHASVNGGAMELVSPTLPKDTTFYTMVGKHGGTPQTRVKVTHLRVVPPGEPLPKAKMPVHTAA